MYSRAHQHRNGLVNYALCAVGDEEVIRCDAAEALAFALGRGNECLPERGRDRGAAGHDNRRQNLE